MVETRNVIADLVADGDSVEKMVAGLDGSRWSLPTPATGWTVADQIAHLSFVFRLAGLAAGQPDRFRAVLAGTAGDFDGAINAALAEHREDSPATLLAAWRADRQIAERALAAVPPDALVPWLVRPIPPAVLASAGMMELFGHGQDIADALGVRRTHTDRLRHVAGFAVAVWDFGYQARGLTPPEEPFRFELTAPSGAVWEFGPAQAAQRVTGSAVDFCLLTTRRRHREDLDLVATGADADNWLNIAQAYRGPAGTGRTPGQFGTPDRHRAA